MWVGVLGAAIMMSGLLSAAFFGSQVGGHEGKLSEDERIEKLTAGFCGIAAVIIGGTMVMVDRKKKRKEKAKGTDGKGGR